MSLIYFGMNNKTKNIMKKLYVLFVAILFATTVFSQTSGEQINELIEFLSSSGKSKESIKEIIKGSIDEPDLYNDLWKKLVEEAMNQDSSQWEFLNDLNIEFKTFQAADSSSSSLGFSYDFDFDYAKFEKKGNSRVSNSFGLTAKGNVAFKKEMNPNDFLETNLNYSFSKFIGGVINKNNDEYYEKLNIIEDSLVTFENPNSAEAMKLWNNFGKYLTFSNQYYYSISPKIVFESNQDFSQTQFAPGVTFNFGAKAWNKNSTLSKLNIFDYPFAILRVITKTDNSFTTYGSTIPVLQLGFDYVVPQNDTIREHLIDNKDPFPRIRIESSFRTLVSRIGKENIFFNAKIRYYQEISAPTEIKNQSLDEHFYFVMSLQSSKGFFVSYANGKLPFDSRNDEVYSLGFNYRF